MLLTEAEAKTKWCPWARVWQRQMAGPAYGGSVAASFNREPGISPSPETARCIASECMAWDWGEGSEVATTLRAHRDSMPPKVEGFKLVSTTHNPDTKLPYITKYQRDFELLGRRGECGIPNSSGRG